MGRFKGSIIVGLVLISLSLIIFELYMSEFKEYKPSQPGITQRTILQDVDSKYVFKLMDQRTGTIQKAGWELNGENSINIATKDPCPISQRFDKLNMWKFRAWNYYLLNTPNHVIQFIFADLQFICKNSLIVFEKGNKQSTFTEYIDHTCKCFDIEKLSSHSSVQSENYQVTVHKLNQSQPNYDININLNQNNGSSTFNSDLHYNYDNSNSQIWSIPLNDDKTEYFLGLKKIALPLQGQYEVNGKKFKCQNNDCLLTLDFGRGAWNYGASYFWALLQTTLKDGRRFALNLGDGIGSEYHTYDKASNDYAQIDSTYYKLDISQMTYSQNDYMKPHFIQTMKDQAFIKKVFKNRNCELQFTPVEEVTNGINLVLIAFKQSLIYGYFDGFCVLDKERIELKKEYGFIEHVYSRW